MDPKYSIIKKLDCNRKGYQQVICGSGTLVCSLLQLSERWPCHIWLVGRKKFASLMANSGGGMMKFASLMANSGGGMMKFASLMANSGGGMMKFASLMANSGGGMMKLASLVANSGGGRMKFASLVANSGGGRMKFASLVANSVGGRIKFASLEANLGGSLFSFFFSLPLSGRSSIMTEILLLGTLSLNIINLHKTMTTSGAKKFCLDI